MPDGFIERMGLQAVLDLKEFRQNARIYDQNLKQLNQQTQKAAEQTQKSADQMAGAWDHFFKQVDATTKGVDKSYKQMATQSKKAATDMEKALTGMAKKALAAAAAFVTLRKAVGFLAQATQLAARVETLGVSLAVVGRNAGYSQEQIDAFEEAVKKQGITTRAARQALLQMAQAQVDFTHASDLARIAQDAAVIAQTDSSEAFQRLTTIIQTGNVLMGRNLGLQLDFQGGYKRLATQLNKTTEELTDQEKVQARVNVVMEAGVLIAGTYEAAMETAGKMQASLNRLFEETQLVIGRIQLGGFATGIEEITRLMKELGKWMEENEEELEALGMSVTMLADAMISFADLDLPVEELTEFVDKMTTLVSMLAVGIETVKEWNIELGYTGEILSKISPLLPAAEMTRGIDAIIDKFTEWRKADEDLFKTQAQLREERKDTLDQEIKDIKEANRAALAAREAAAEAARATEAERLAALEEMREKAAEKLQGYLDRIADMQLAHDRKLADMAEDYRIKRERAWAKYEKSVVKEITKGQKAIAKLEAKYRKRRDKAFADYAKRVSKVEKDLARDIAKAQADFALRQSQVQERLQLDRIQSERRYQFERARLVAEGDTLAIEELDARYKLEQEEQRENEALRKKQAKETQRAMVEAMKEAGREQAKELVKALAEQMAELQEQSREEIEEREQANRDRIDEMATGYADQQRLADEDHQRSIEKADRNYERQLEDLGRNLADQEELQELGAEQTEWVLDQYYGEGGISDRIMEGWHERENTRILVTAALLGQLAAGASQGPLLPGGVPMPGQEVGMDQGGIVAGPATVRVGAGIVEAFTPLGNIGGGGFDLSWSGGPIPISGLEGASPTDVSRIARELAESLTAKIRTRRRN